MSASADASSIGGADNTSSDETVEVQDGDLVALPDSSAAAVKSGRKERKPDPTYQWVILGMCTVALTLSLLMSVREGTRVLMPILGKPLPELCHMRRYTGVDCPGCGMTRAFISLGHGRLSDAWRYNPAAFLLFPLMVFQIPFRAVQLWRMRRGLPELMPGWWGSAAVLGVVAVMVGQWVVKQLGVSLG